MKNIVERIRVYKEKHPVILAIILVVLYMGIFYSMGIGIQYFVKSEITYLPDLISESLGIGVAVLIIFVIGEQNLFTKKRTGMFKGIFIGGFLVYIGVSALYTNLSMVEKGQELLPTAEIVVFVLLMFAIGLAEELVFRGIVFNLLWEGFEKKKHPFLYSVLLSGIIFGSVHLLNFFAGASLQGAAIQAVGVIGIGALLAAIYIRTGNIWVVAILHGFFDLGGLAAAGFYGEGTVTSEISSYGPIKLVAILVYMIPTLFLLRRKKREEILPTKREGFSTPMRTLEESISNLENAETLEISKDIEEKRLP